MRFKYVIEMTEYFVGKFLTGEVTYKWLVIPHLWKLVQLLNLSEDAVIQFETSKARDPAFLLWKFFRYRQQLRQNIDSKKYQIGR